MSKLPSIYPLYGSHYNDEVGIVVKPSCCGGADSITDEDIANIAKDIIDKGLVEIPEDKFLKDVEFDHDKFTLTFNVGSEDTEEVKPIAVSLAGMLKTYTAGENVTISPQGEISVDLSGYVGKEELESKSYVTSEALANEHYVSEDTLEAKGYATTAEVESKGYVTEQTLDEKGFATVSDMESRGYVNEEALEAKNYTTMADVEAKNYVDTTALDEKHYVTETALEEKGYLTEHQDLSGYATKDEIPSLEGYAKSEEVNTVSAEVDKTVKFDTDKDGRKIITFDNAELVMARANTEPLENKVDITGGVPLIQLNRWNVVDVGSPKTITNINTPDGVRPTVQEKSQSGPEAHKIAYLDDLSVVDDTVSEVDTLKATIATMEAKFAMLNNKYQELSKTDVEFKTDFNGGDELSNVNVDYVIETPALTAPAKIVGKSVELKNASIIPASAMESSVKRSPVAIEAKDVKVDGLVVTGSFDTNLNSNAVVAVNNAAFVEIKDAVFDGENFYNGIEVGLASNSTVLPKNIVFDNCHFKNYFTHNAFSVFRMQNDATITLNNCRFDDIVGVMRITNSTNAKNITININNCVLDSIEHNIGLILFQDNVSKNASAFYETNMFGDGKITVNINNLIANGEKVVSDLVGLGAKPCAVNVYASGVKYLSYTEENKKYFPIINIR